MIGGQGWPWRTENQIGPSYGYASTEGYLPDWRSNHDGYALAPAPRERHSSEPSRTPEPPAAAPPAAGTSAAESRPAANRPAAFPPPAETARAG